MEDRSFSGRRYERTNSISPYLVSFIGRMREIRSQSRKDRAVGRQETGAIRLSGFAVGIFQLRVASPEVGDGVADQEKVESFFGEAL